jgi:hypothetical protein
MIFYIANVNPLRFTGGMGNKFDTLHMEKLINQFQDVKQYFQKWLPGDRTTVQILSDYEFTFKIYDLDGLFVEEIVPTEVESSIVGKSFKVYEVPLEFSLEGCFYAVIEYEAGTLISEPWKVGDFSDTMLFKYKNSENNFSLVFDAGLELYFRVEGLITNFEPKADDVIYNDQERNSLVLNSVPWRSFTLFAGQAEGIPDWIADKVNRIMSCDIVWVDAPSFDGYITKVEGAEWEVLRAEQNPFIGIRTEIMQVENNLLERLKRGGEGGNLNIRIVQKIDNYYDVDGSLTISGTFAKYRLLEKICIEKSINQPDFELSIGTTNGGQDIGRFQVNSTAVTLQLQHLFLGATTIFISGISNPIPFMSIIYKNLLEQPADLGGGTGEAGNNVPVGGVIEYNPIPGRTITDDFEVLTGLGKEGTGWYGWAICNGMNGTQDHGDKFSLGYKFGTNNIGDTGGAKEHVLTEAELPAHGHDYQNMVGNTTKRGNTGSEFINFTPVNRQTGNTGGNQPHNNMPPFIVSPKVQRIF